MKTIDLVWILAVCCFVLLIWAISTTRIAKRPLKYFTVANNSLLDKEFLVKKKHLRFLLLFDPHAAPLIEIYIKDENLLIKWRYWKDEEWNPIYNRMRYSILFEKGGLPIDFKKDQIFLIDIVREKSTRKKLTIRSRAKSISMIDPS